MRSNRDLNHGDFGDDGDDCDGGDDGDDGDDGDLLTLLPWHKTTLLSGHRLTYWLLDLCVIVRIMMSIGPDGIKFN